MSLMGTLGKVAMGVIVAKGVGKMMGSGGSGNSSGGGLLGGLLGSITGGGNAGRAESSGGGLSDLLSGLAGKTDSGGGLGGILDSLGGGSKSSGGLGDIFNNALQGNEPEKVDDEQEKEAEILLRAMLNAAKSDGEIDAEEQRKITEHLEDVSEEEANFVREELNAPLDVKAFINSVPRGLEEKVYFMSLLAIDLDSEKEAKYLNQLSQGLSISHDVCNQIHEKLGAPVLYS